jgi:hypothetical protein
MRGWIVAGAVALGACQSTPPTFTWNLPEADAGQDAESDAAAGMCAEGETVCVSSSAIKLCVSGSPGVFTCAEVCAPSPASACGYSNTKGKDVCFCGSAPVSKDSANCPTCYDTCTKTARTCASKCIAGCGCCDSACATDCEHNSCIGALLTCAAKCATNCPATHVSACQKACKTDCDYLYGLAAEACQACAGGGMGGAGGYGAASNCAAECVAACP